MTTTELTLEEFWALPPAETAYELVDGQALPKVSPKSFHSFLQGALDRLIHPWCRGLGRVGPEWAVVLKRNGKDWVPTPDASKKNRNSSPVARKSDTLSSHN